MSLVARTRLAAFAPLALSLALVAVGPTTHAKDTTQRFGIGGVVGPDRSGPAIRFWIDRVGFALSGGLDLFAGGGETVSRLDLEAQVLFQAARFDDTHLVLGAGLRFAFGNPGVYEGLPTAGGSDVTTSIDLSLAVEHFFGDHFAIAGVISAPIEFRDITFPATGPDDTTTTLSGTSIRLLATWGAEFTCYF